MSAAGSIPVMRPDETAGLHKLPDRHLSVESPNPEGEVRFGFGLASTTRVLVIG